MDIKHYPNLRTFKQDNFDVGVSDFVNDLNRELRLIVDRSSAGLGVGESTTTVIVNNIADFSQDIRFLKHIAIGGTTVNNSTVTGYVISKEDKTFTNIDNEVRGYQATVRNVRTTPDGNFGGLGWDFFGYGAAIVVENLNMAADANIRGQMKGFQSELYFRRKSGGLDYTVTQPTMGYTSALVEVNPDATITNWYGFNVGQPNSLLKEWAASTVVFLGQQNIPTAISSPSTGSAHIHEATALIGDQKTAGSEPTWNTTVGGTTTDGNVTWTNRGAITTPLNNVTTGYGIRIASLLDAAQTLTPATTAAIRIEGLDNFGRILWGNNSWITGDGTNLELTSDGVIQLLAESQAIGVNILTTGAGHFDASNSVGGGYYIGGTEVINPSRALGNIIRTTLDEVAAPGTPGAGTVHLYAKSDGKVYYKDDLGAETGPLAAAGSGIGGSGTTGTIPKFTASTTLGDSLLVETAGKVSVGVGNILEADAIDILDSGFSMRYSSVSLTANRTASAPNATGTIAYATAPGTSGSDINWDSNSKLNVPSASATARGVITTGSQTIAGNKTFSGTVIAFTGANITVSGFISTATLTASAQIDAGTYVNVVSGYRILTAAASGQYIRGNGTNGVFSAILSGDLPSHNHSGTDITTGTVNAARLPEAASGTAGILNASGSVQAISGPKKFDSAVEVTQLKTAGGIRVVGTQQAAVSNASGGATIDAEARTAINALLARCRSHGLIAT